jgi:nucleotide-binding universal stress UspA family protein
MEKILLPVDGSEASLKAYNYAKEMTKKFGSELTVIHIKHEFAQPHQYQKAVDLPTLDVENMIAEYEKKKDYPDNFIADIGQKILDNAIKYFEDEGIEVKSEILQGRPATTIMEYAENNDFDLIVMCTHGMSIPRRFTLGSVTNKVVHHSKVPVFVIREED